VLEDVVHRLLGNPIKIDRNIPVARADSLREVAAAGNQMAEGCEPNRGPAPRFDSLLAPPLLALRRTSGYQRQYFAREIQKDSRGSQFLTERVMQVRTYAAALALECFPTFDLAPEGGPKNAGYRYSLDSVLS
jgi:hypothetical protein